MQYFNVYSYTNFRILYKINYIQTHKMTTQTPTEIQRIHKIESEFEKITKSKGLQNVIKNFYQNPNQTNYDYIIRYLQTSINFDYQYVGENNFDFYLYDKNYSILASCIGNVFSTYEEYVVGLNLYNLTEEQQLLNYYAELEKDKYISVNLLEEPIGNLLINYLENQSGGEGTRLLYYFSAKKPKNEKYSLIAFIYKKL